VAREPESLVLELLREMRGDIAGVQAQMCDLAGKFDALRGDMDEWRETIASARGFSVHANVRSKKLEDEVADLRRRVEKLEKAQ